MPCTTCTSTAFRSISRAMAKAAAARLRRTGALPTRVDWAARAAICERCPLRVISRGVTHCGTPFLRQVDRDPVVDGCGCPTRDKARSPAEHCPITRRHAAAAQVDGGCDCKWCAGAAADAV